MFIADMHCDTVLGLLEDPKRNLKENDLCVDLKKLVNANSIVQNFALFTDQKVKEIPEYQTMLLYDRFSSELEKYSDVIKQVRTYDEIIENKEKGILSALLTLEDGGVCFNDLAMLRNYYRMGVRMITLTWNYPNGIGFPNLNMGTIQDYKQPVNLQQIDTVHGLTDFGIQYIQEMERLGIIIDVSHLNDAGFYDVLRYTKKPFVASHSNSRSVCNVARNMSDDMILQLAKRKGVMGINFCGGFLKEDSNESRIEDMVKHIEYIRDLAGIDVIGLGTDFDGINSILEIEDISQMHKLETALYEHGFTKQEVEKIFYKNVLRVYKEILK